MITNNAYPYACTDKRAMTVESIMISLLNILSPLPLKITPVEQAL